MASVIIYPKGNCPRFIYNDHEFKIRTTNWRTVGEISSDKIEIVTMKTRRYVVHMTLNAFHEMNLHNDSIIAKFRFINTTLTCFKCHGKGKLDWIQKVRGETQPLIQNLSNYRRNKNVINRFNIKGKNIKTTHKLITLYGSEPNISKGFEICPECRGTGLHEKFYPYDAN